MHAIEAVFECAESSEMAHVKHAQCLTLTDACCISMGI